MIRRTPLFFHQPAVVQLVVLFLLVLCFWIVSFFLGVVLSRLFFGIPVLETLSGIAIPETRNEINLLKFMQLINQFGTFLIPPFLFAFLVSTDIREYLGLQKKPNLLPVLSAIILIYLLLPVINELVRINQNMSLPSCLSAVEEWMRVSEMRAEKMTKAFMRTTSIKGLLINLLIIGVLAAVGEELLFRAVLIRVFRSWFKSSNWAVIISAFIFSAFHLQFYGFLPRFLLGLVFGYLFVWSGSLFLPIIAHFINNASAVIISFLMNRGIVEVSVDEFGKVDNPILLIISIILSIALMYFIYWYEKKADGVYLKKDNTKA